MKVVDVDGLSRFSLGSHRKNLSEKQLKKYTEYLEFFLQKIYLVDYKTTAIKISKSLAQKKLMKIM